jgi:hypothetical protein
VLGTLPQRGWPDCGDKMMPPGAFAPEAPAESGSGRPVGFPGGFVKAGDGANTPAACDGGRVLLDLGC